MPSPKRKEVYNECHEQTTEKGPTPSNQADAATSTRVHPPTTSGTGGAEPYRHDSRNQTSDSRASKEEQLVASVSANTEELTELEIKAVVRRRDGMRCTDCGISNKEHIALTSRQLDVHRLVPGSPYSINGCVTLCRSCHGSKPKSPKGSNPNSTMNVRVSENLHSALCSLANSERRTKTRMAYLLLEDALRQRGLWPPSEPILR